MRSWKDVIVVFMFVFGMYMLIRGLIGIAYADEENTIAPPQLRMTTVSSCGDYEQMTARLVNEYNEVGVASGQITLQLSTGEFIGGDLHFFAHPETRDYTLIFTNYQIACIIGAGKAFGAYYQSGIDS